MPSPVGGVLIGGTAPVGFTPGAADAQVDADVVVEWDFDNDGDFGEAVEDVTEHVLAMECRAGRDFPSQLTGKAGPGQLRLSLRNEAGRFSYFNTASPLNSGPFSLKVGRKIRVRATEATGVDPVLLARDRFLGNGMLAVDEVGNTWTAGAGMFFQSVDSAGVHQAVPAALAAGHLADVDVGTQDAVYVQVQWRFVDVGNEVGVVYRRLNTSNYGAVFVVADEAGGLVVHRNRTAGVNTDTAIATIEYRHDDFVGVLVDGATATVLHNGVELGSATAHASPSDRVGIYAEWNTQRAPAVREFYCWDGLPAEDSGVIFTGDVTSVMPTSIVDGPPTVAVEAVGRLERAASYEVAPPNSIGIIDVTPAFSSPGSTAGQLVGGTLGRIGLLHPPYRIDRGDTTLGAVGLPKADALTSMRAHEEAELGFLHETPEGGVAFHGRSARDDTPSSGWWSDTPGLGQYRFKAIEPYDWRGETINRVEAGIAPKTPNVLAFGGENTAATQVIIPMPDAANGARVGDLFLVIIASSIAEPGVQWLIPTGWTEYRRANDQIGRVRLYGKIVEEDDINSNQTFLIVTSPMGAGDFVSRNVLVKDFYGDLQQGLAISDVLGYGHPTSTAKARAGVNNPAAVFPGWAPAPSAVLVIRAGMTRALALSVTDPNTNDFYSPNGFCNLVTSVSANDTAMQIAFLNTADEVIDPSPFLTDISGAFNNFDQVETVTIAIRGFAGDPPETSGGQTVVVEDFASQEDHNAIRTHTNAARLFATAPDAEAYGQAVLDEFATDRPIFRLTFDATLSPLYREQALARRVGDRIHLTATGDTVMGVDADFFVESIAHSIASGGKVWQVQWELSPA